MLSMILPGMAVTYNGDEIGMVDKRDISWEDTQDPQACNAGKEQYKKVSRDPERTPFQWDATKNAGKERIVISPYFIRIIRILHNDIFFNFAI